MMDEELKYRNLSPSGDSGKMEAGQSDRLRISKTGDRSRQFLIEKLEKYFAKAKPLFEDIQAGEQSQFNAKSATKKIMDMALSYYSDAKHFQSKGEYVNALAALEYAEGWLDAGRYTGLLKYRNLSPSGDSGKMEAGQSDRLRISKTGDVVASFYKQTRIGF